MTFSWGPSKFVKADSVDSDQYLALGADLSSKEKQTVLELLGVSNTSDYTLITVTNKEEHDYLGDGTILFEYNLEKGKMYTFIRGEMKSYGAMVFLKEVSSQYGFQAYLFEELEPYNKQIAAEAYEKWLKKELEMAEEDISKGRVYTMEEVQEHLDRIR